MGTRWSDPDRREVARLLEGPCLQDPAEAYRRTAEKLNRSVAAVLSEAYRQLAERTPR